MASYARRHIVGGASVTTLSADITSGDTTFTIADATGWPTGGASGDFFTVLDRGNSGEEKILCASRTGTTVTVQTSGRGSDSTTAAAHGAGVAAEHCLTARDLDEANFVVSETIGLIAAQGDILVGDAANSLAKLAKGTSGLPLVAGASTVSYATIDGGALATGAVTAGKIGTGGISAAAQFAAGVVDAAAIGTAAVTSNELQDLAVTTGKITDANVTAAKLAASIIPAFTTFVKSGTLTTGAGTIRFRFPVAATLVHTRLAANTAPTGASILVDVNKNGTTVYTTQGNRPVIAVSAFAETSTTAPDVTAIAAGDYITVDIDQIGSTIAGADLTITVYYKVSAV